MHERWHQMYSIVTRGDNWPAVVMLILVATMIGVATAAALRPRPDARPARDREPPDRP